MSLSKLPTLPILIVDWGRLGADQHELWCLLVQYFVDFLTIDSRLFLVFIQKLFFSSSAFEGPRVSHQTEVCTVRFKHFVELLGFGFGPFAALDEGLAGGFIDVFVRFGMGVLFIFGNDV